MGLLDTDEFEPEAYLPLKTDEIKPQQQAEPQVDTPDNFETLTFKPRKREETETVRVSLKRLNNLLSLAEELAACQSVFKFIAESLGGVYSLQQALHKGFSHEEIPVITDRMKEALKRVNQLADLLGRQSHEQRMVADELIFGLRQIMLFPVSELIAVLPRMVRDIAAEAGKMVELEIQGGEITVDKRILEGLKDPLIHLVRNCLDHGIEKPGERRAVGKPEKGKLLVQVSINSDGKVQLMVADDGKGIDTKRLREKAVEKGLLTQEEADTMHESDALRLVFKSGLSTSEVVSRISGHGLGMSIVAEKVWALNGAIDISSSPSRGTHFIITLPRMLALFRGIRIRSAGHQFLLPTASIQSALRIRKNDIQTLAAKPYLVFDGMQLPLVTLESALALHRPTGTENGKYFNVLIVNAEAQRYALLVDDVLGEEEGVVLPFDAGITANRLFSGVLPLGDGSLVPVLKPVILSEKKASVNMMGVDKKVSKLLVVDDSLTVRNLLRGMLEMEGFSVRTAVNGAEALHLAQQETYNAIITDIEMPTMNGFELTKSLRNLPEYDNVPIILVTSLDSDDDRRYGMNVGASAYIVKSSFEKGSLIETLNSLIL